MVHILCFMGLPSSVEYIFSKQVADSIEYDQEILMHYLD